MRILWIASTACNYVPVGRSEEGYNGGSWVSSMQNELQKHDDITLGIAFCMNGQPDKVVQNGVTYYIIPDHIKKWKDKIVDFIRIKDVKRDEVVWPQYLDRLRRIISDFNPDVIHIFGSELYQDLVALVTGDIPTVLHIQGILSECIFTLLPPGVSKSTPIRPAKGIHVFFSNRQFLAYWRRSVYREKVILYHVKHVIGRTDWDKQCMAVINPQAKYHYGGELLRDVFYTFSDRVLPKKTIITTTISAPTYKGFDVVLKVANILKNEVNLDFEWNVFGNVEPKVMERVTGLEHSDLNINILGVASSEEVKKALLHSTMYVHPSYIENGCIAIAEAQISSIPVVASNVGGVSTTVEHGKTGFLFPVTDPYMAAYYIERLASDRELNIRIGQQAREVALRRHDKDEIVAQLLRTYEEISQDGGLEKD